MFPLILCIFVMKLGKYVQGQDLFWMNWKMDAKACTVYCDLESDFIDLGTEIRYFNPISSPCLGMAFMARDIRPPFTDSINSHLSFSTLGGECKELHILKHRKYSKSVFLKHWFNKTTSHFIWLILSVWNAICFSINVWLEWMLSTEINRREPRKVTASATNVTKVIWVQLVNALKIPSNYMWYFKHNINFQLTHL